VISSLVVLLLAQAANIRATKHNLSTGGTGTIRASAQDQVCVFCHTPHGAAQSKAVWNRDLAYQAGATFFTLYGSSTLDAVPARPNGAAKLCLSCHDGTIALGSLMNLEGARPATVAMQGGLTSMPAGPTRLGTDLRNDHPVSLVPSTADPEVRLPPAGDAVKLKEGATSGVRDSVQCTSCHDPHLDTLKFLVKANTRGALCLTCHVKLGWLGSRHEASSAPYPASGSTTVGDLACLTCHQPHNGEGPTRLLSTRNLSGSPLPWAEENVCFSCHRSGGTGVDPLRGGAAPDIQGQWSKASHHPFELKTDEHQPIFTAHQPEPEPVALPTKHVECPDCHNPHRAIGPDGGAPALLAGASRVRFAWDGGTPFTFLANGDSSSTVKEYEICFKCHSTWTTLDAGTKDKAQEFDPRGGSFHPVVAAGTNSNTTIMNANLAGGLGLPHLTTTSTVECQDCHASDSLPLTVTSVSSYVGSIARGPHGSSIDPAAGYSGALLRARYRVTGSPGTLTTDGELCFICHASAFSSTTTRFTAQSHHKSIGLCNECHSNIHGTKLGATASNSSYSRLVNFASSVTGSSGTGSPSWTANTGTNNSGSCNLRCHGKTHSPENY